MSFFFQTDRQAAASRFDRGPAPGPSTGLMENYEAAAEALRRSDLSVSRMLNLSEAYDDRIETLERLTGRRLPNPVNDPVPKVFADEPRWADPVMHAARNTLDARMASFEREVNAIRAQQPYHLWLMIETGEQMLTGIKSRAQAAEQKAREIGARATTVGVLGALAGTAVESLSDPLNLVTLPLGAPSAIGRSAALAIVRTGAIEGLINAGVTAVAAPFVQEYRAELGLPFGAGRAAQDVALAGVAGAVLGAGVTAIGRSPELVAALNKKLAEIPASKAIEIFKRTVPNPTPEQRAAFAMLEREAELDAGAPAPEATAAHRQRLEQEIINASEGRPAAPATAAPTPTVSRETLQRWADNPEEVERGDFLATEIGVNAKTWQFKTGGDAEGVVETLRGVKKWNPWLAGEITVYRYADGRVEVIDGHQRVGLAKRLMAEGHAPIRLHAQVLDAAEFPVPEARALASLKNLVQQDPRRGATLDIEAAKLVREVGPDGFEVFRPMMAPAHARIRQARALLSLSEEAFSDVINERIPVSFAAAVANAVPDDGPLQKALIEALRAEQPDNLFQAEAIVQAALAAGATRVEQLDLLGGRTVATLLLGARAKVLDAALKSLKRDARVFGLLNKERETIEGAGNTLATATNERKAELNGQAAEILQTLANRAGPIADALKRLSPEAHATRRYDRAGRELAELVAGEIERAGVKGLIDGGSGRNVGLAPSVERAQSEAEGDPGPGLNDPSLSLFDEPSGKGAADQAAALERVVRSELGPEAEPAAAARGDGSGPGPAEGAQGREGLKPTSATADPTLRNLEIPDGITLDPASGETVVSTRPLGEVLDEIEADREFVEQLDLCLGGRP